jgi:glycine/D-amino acid oxidase-like deaminating enzyme/nitrite reductase/ring-hydroxylating ferredoxin subunit
MRALFFMPNRKMNGMKRDGATVSLWQSNVDDYMAKPAGINETVFDVLVAGGGITGITTALLLQKQGKKCLVAEAHSLCFGTTGGTTAHINSFLDTPYDQIQSDFSTEAAQLVAKATNSSRELFKKHVSEYKIDCGFEEKQGYVYAQTQEQVDELDKMFEASKQAGTAVDYTQEIPVPVEFKKAIVYPAQAQLHPTLYVQALAKAFEEGGGVILQNCAVDTVEKEADLLNVTTSNGTIKAANLIWATHIPPGINILHFRDAPYRSYAIAVRLNGEYPDHLSYDMYDPYHYYRTQEVDGQKYFIVGGEDHKTAHEENTEACFNNLIAHTKQYFDVAEVTHRWSSQYYEPSDGLAYIGHLPGNPANVYVATGYGGNGITYSHIAAQLLTDLITTGDSEYKDLFSPSRIKPIAGFAAFVQENADVVKEFVTKRLSPEKIDGLSELAHGEGKVVKLEGETVALYKDDAGRVHALNPVCTHAKCIVGWNTAEKTWDCPCHGARYNVEGEVLTGPARRDLQKIELSDLIEGKA